MTSMKSVCSSIAKMLLAIVLLCLFQTVMAQDIPSQNKQLHLPPLKSLIRSEYIGQWTKDHESGRIRYLMYQGGEEEVETILYIQWLALDKTSNKQKVISTVEIIPILGVFKPPKIVSKKPLTLYIAIGSFYCNEPQRYKIKILGVGKYELKYLNKNQCAAADKY